MTFKRKHLSSSICSKKKRYKSYLAVEECKLQKVGASEWGAIFKSEYAKSNLDPLRVSQDFTFSGTDNGIVKMSESVPVSLERYDYHLKLHNRFAALTEQTEPEFMTKQAGNKWMLISQRFKKEGVSPNRPLYCLRSWNCRAIAASLILRAFVEDSIDKAKMKEVKKELTASVQTSSSIVKLLKKYLIKLCKAEKVPAEDFCKVELKKDMLEIYEKVLAGTVKRSNTALAKEALEKIRKSKNSVF
ncbi:hypothetical protein BD560DRAFT_494086 [Blakeslea trispora]|nr:hypothetical protein BD560DRAFT_494086 [Blakeslea trispora]